MHLYIIHSQCACVHIFFCSFTIPYFMCARECCFAAVEMCFSLFCSVLFCSLFLFVDYFRNALCLVERQPGPHMRPEHFYDRYNSQLIAYQYTQLIFGGGGFYFRAEFQARERERSSQRKHIVMASS